jgi:hypothetical protein
MEKKYFSETIETHVAYSFEANKETPVQVPENHSFKVDRILIRGPVLRGTVVELILTGRTPMPFFADWYNDGISQDRCIYFASRFTIKALLYWIAKCKTSNLVVFGSLIQWRE